MADRVKFLAVGCGTGKECATPRTTSPRVRPGEHTIVASMRYRRYRMIPTRATGRLPLMLQNAWEAAVDSGHGFQARGGSTRDYARMLTLAAQDTRVERGHG